MLHHGFVETGVITFTLLSSIIATGQCKIIPYRAFAVNTGVFIVIYYFMCLAVLPAAVSFVEVRIDPCWRRCIKKCCNCKWSDNAMTKVQRAFFGPYSRVTNAFRYILLLLLIGVGVFAFTMALRVKLPSNLEV